MILKSIQKKEPKKRKIPERTLFPFFGKAPESEEDEKYKKEKPRDRRYVLLRLWSYLYQYKWLLFLALFLTIVSNLLGLVGPMLSGYAIDAIHGPNDVDFPLVFFYAALDDRVLRPLFSADLYPDPHYHPFQPARHLSDAQRRVDKHHGTAGGLFRPYPDRRHHQPDSYDIDTVNASLSNDLLQSVPSVITVIGSLVMMLMIAPALVSVFVIIIGIHFADPVYDKESPSPFRKRSAKLGELNGYTEEIISGQKTIKAYHQEENYDLTVLSRKTRKPWTPTTTRIITEA